MRPQGHTFPERQLLSHEEEPEGRSLMVGAKTAGCIVRARPCLGFSACCLT